MGEETSFHGRLTLCQTGLFVKEVCDDLEEKNS